MKPDYLDIFDRARTGAPVEKPFWDMEHILLPVRRLIKHYDLTWDRHTVIPQDSALIDRLFLAGLDLAAETGVLCAETGRVIRFTRDEIVTAAHAMPTKLVMGEGADARTLFARKVIDTRPPLIWAGNPGAPTPEALFKPSVKSWMQEPLVDMATCGSLVAVGGRPLEGGGMLEIHAARQELTWLREALLDVGRPGMGLLAGQSAVTEVGDLAIASPRYLRQTDAHLVALFNELIIDKVNMARALNSAGYGMRNASLATVMVGGLGGDAPGAAVVQVASLLLANLVCLADYHLVHPIHIRHVATSTRSVLWVQSAVAQAFARNAPCILFADIYPKSGAMTRELLYEVAANALVATVSGAHLEGVGSADGALPNGTGLEVRWMAEVGRAAAAQGVDLALAEAMVQPLLAMYEPVFSLPGGNPGVPFDKAYDLESLEPRQVWADLYDSEKRAVNQRIKLGI